MFRLILLVALYWVTSVGHARTDECEQDLQPSYSSVFRTLFSVLGSSDVYYCEDAIDPRSRYFAERLDDLVFRERLGFFTVGESGVGFSDSRARLSQRTNVKSQIDDSADRESVLVEVVPGYKILRF